MIVITVSADGTGHGGRGMIDSQGMLNLVTSRDRALSGEHRRQRHAADGENRPHPAMEAIKHGSSPKPQFQAAQRRSTRRARAPSGLPRRPALVEVVDNEIMGVPYARGAMGLQMRVVQIELWMLVVKRFGIDLRPDHDRRH